MNAGSLLRLETHEELLEATDGSPFAVLAFTVRRGRVVRLDVLADQARLAQLDLTLLAGPVAR